MLSRIGTRIMNHIRHGAPLWADPASITPISLEDARRGENDAVPEADETPQPEYDRADVGTVGTEPHHPS